MPSYLPRVVDEELDELLTGLPAISLEGPKAVGKTATAERRAATVFKLERSGERALIEADPSLVTRGDPPVLIDEWQRVPEVWDVVRRAVDDNPRSSGRFLLTGSASPTRQPTHSGAGRIVTVRMRPMALAERGRMTPTVSLRELLGGDRAPVEGHSDWTLADYTDAIIESGFPGLQGLPPRLLRTQLDGWLHRIVDRDIADAGHRVRNPAALTRWLTAYAAATATTASYEAIRDAATAGEADKPARSTTLSYRDALQSLWVLDPLTAWLPVGGPLRQLARSPKHHLVDPALAARLLGLDAEALLTGRDIDDWVPRDGVLLGHLFESLVVLCVRVYAQASEASVMHMKDQRGNREVDLIVRGRARRVLAIEVKLGTVDDRDVRHLRWLGDQLGDNLLDAMVVTTGPYAYRRPDGIAVVPLALLGP
jgi:predicted AAA+ superfamily ATPase